MDLQVCVAVILTPPHLRRLTPLDRPRLLTTPSMPSTAAHWLSSRARARRAGAHAAAAAACLGQRTRRRAASGRPYTDEILQYMGRSCKQEHELTSPQASGGGSSRPASRYLRPIDIVLDGHGLMKLPPLESPSAATTLSSTPTRLRCGLVDHRRRPPAAPLPPPHGLGHDGPPRRVAHLNGYPDALDDQVCFDAAAAATDASAADGLAYYSATATRLLGGAIGGDDDLWSFARSAAPLLPPSVATPEHLSHISGTPWAEDAERRRQMENATEWHGSNFLKLQWHVSVRPDRSAGS
ncbi:hypothetical protein DAI22_11g135501 [Oryza sativa Japonica Group]|nr:hypothetical protein DAI22_11g135501 [Oryza sativa Japonica Group]